MLSGGQVQTVDNQAVAFARLDATMKTSLIKMLMNVKEAGKKGGLVTKKKGRDYFSKIGRKGGLKNKRKSVTTGIYYSTTWIPKKVRRLVFERCKFKCVYCKIYLKNSQKKTIDHKVQRYLGGSDEMSNLVLACRKCNGRRGSRTFKQSQIAATKGWPKKIYVKQKRTR